jgi:chemotaxis protein CheC
MQAIVDVTEPKQTAWHSVFEPATESASQAMQAWTNGQVMLSLSGVQELPLEEVSAALLGGDELSLIVVLDLVGPFGGQFIMQLTEPSARELVALLLHRPVDSLVAWGELENSVVAETGNILASAYLNQITLLTGCRVMPSPPQIVHDYAASVLESAVLSQAMACERVLLCQTRFQLQGEPIPWNVLFVPSLDLLMQLSLGLESDANA